MKFAIEFESFRVDLFTNYALTHKSRDFTGNFFQIQQLWVKKAIVFAARTISALFYM